MSQSLSSVGVKDYSNTQKLMRTVEDSSSSIHVSGVDKIVTPVGGASRYRIVSDASDNATLVKGSAGKLYGYYLASIDATDVFLKIYDIAEAPDENDTPILTIPVVGGNASWGSAERDFWECGIGLSNGLGFRITTALADDDTGAVAADENVGYLVYA